jgi:hypothetical protein
MKKISRCLLTLAPALVLAASISALGQPPAEPSLQLPPTGKAAVLRSPDKQWALIAKPFPQHTVLLQKRATHKNALVLKYERAGKVGWSPDSRAFYFDDQAGSNVEDAYVYWIGASAPLELNSAILSSDKEAAAVQADHAYFHAQRWIDAGNLEVEYCGHGGSNPVVQFGFVYTVTLQGPGKPAATVMRTSALTRPSTSLDCDLTAADR